MALASLEAPVRRRILPLAEIQDRPYDWQVEAYTKSWRPHIDAVAVATAKYWGQDQEIAIDQPLEGSSGDDAEKDFASPWRYLFERLWDEGVQAVPVVSSWASPQEVAELARLQKNLTHRRFLLRCRFDEEEHGTSARAVGLWFRKTLKRLHARHADVDAVFDLGYLAGSVEEGATENYCLSVLRELSLQGPWRTLTLASGAFPVNLAGFKTGAHAIERKDWKLYERVVDQTLGGVLYGDYGVNYTDAFDMDPRAIRMSANLRYTHFDHWRVYKARSVKEYGFDQYKQLCQLLVASSEYFGPGFSEGDKSIFSMATDLSKGPGNATTWRRDAMNHHLHVVLNQLEKRR